MCAPFFVGDHLLATLASKVNNLELIAQVSVHYRRVEPVGFTARAVHGLVEPFFQTVVIEYLLAVLTLHVLVLNHIEADRAQERVDKFLVCFDDVLLHQFVVTCEREHKTVGSLVNRLNEIFRFALLVFLEPRVVNERALIVMDYCDWLL